MNVLLIGAGGREDALAWKLSQSPQLSRLYAAPGNPGIARHAKVVALDIADHAAVAAFCQRQAIGLVVVGPEAPLAAGIADDLQTRGISVFGPSQAAARLETSKGFTKDLCIEAGIPTAAFARFNDAVAANAYVRARGAPIVVKADGLAAGKGVTIADSVEEALAAVAACFGGAFGEAGAEVVIEDRLVGQEASFFALSDGRNAVALATAQDHKRAFDGDSGPNTGGMGAFSPAMMMTAELAETVMSRIIRPTVATMARRGTPFVGVLYAGLMITANGPQLIEYNARFGDPETQVLMMRLDSDLLDLMLATVNGAVGEVNLRWHPDTALTVVLAANGYPGKYRKRLPIAGIERAEALPGVRVFHAGTEAIDGRLVSAGGRVLNVTARAPTLAEARSRAYAATALIDFPDGFYRRDIGARGEAG